jgi:excinuclease ABC subunit C
MTCLPPWLGVRSSSQGFDAGVSAVTGDTAMEKSVDRPGGDNSAYGEFDAADFVRHLTPKPGVYTMMDQAGRVIYVGKARNLKRRVGSYFQGRALDAKTIALLRQVRDLQVTVTRTETEALILEYNLIKQHKPRFNVLLRDDKSYPYIRLTTSHEFPRLTFYRGPRTREDRLFGPYPNAGSVRETLNQLHKLFRLRQCEDSYFANRTRPCLQYQLERCTAPCTGLISREDYARDVDNAVLFLQGDEDAVTASLAQRMESAAARLDFERAAQYRDQLARLRQVQTQQLMTSDRGEFDVIGVVGERGVYCVSVMYFRGGRSLGSRSFFPSTTEGSDEAEVLRAFLLQYYGGREAPPEILVSGEVADAEAIAGMLGEKAGRRVQVRWRVRGDRARWVDLALTNARHGAEQRQLSGATMTAQLAALAEALDLDETPGRLECFDVSHTGGESTVASCVVFGPEGARRSSYRRFNVTGVEAGDDYGALRQALMRRYARHQGVAEESGAGGLPDLLIIDGGRGQLAEAVRVLDELGLALPVIGVAKGSTRKPGMERLFLPGRREPLRLPPSSPALHLIQQIRDEAHRFAIAGHRAQRGKRRSRSPLEDIPGLGPKRRRALLTRFGGLQALSRAGVDELAEVKGISRRLAEAIYEHFHSD